MKGGMDRVEEWRREGWRVKGGREGGVEGGMERVEEWRRDGGWRGGEMDGGGMEVERGVEGWRVKGGRGGGRDGGRDGERDGEWKDEGWGDGGWRMEGLGVERREGGGINDNARLCSVDTAKHVNEFQPFPLAAWQTRDPCGPPHLH